MQGDGRDWKEYNEKLIRRGEILLDLDFLKRWNRELEEMNEGKGWTSVRIPGQLYQFPIGHLPHL
jgi:hypothetical protein